MNPFRVKHHFPIFGKAFIAFLTRKNNGVAFMLKFVILDLTSEQLLQPDMDKACIPAIIIKASQYFIGESCLMSAFTKIFLGK